MTSARTGDKSGKQNAKTEDEVRIEDDLDALFKLPLTEFTAARNILAARLKRAGSGDAAEGVKTLAKPSISAWAVNQLYWKHRDAFNALIAAGERFRAAHAAQLGGKVADMRGTLTARREALSSLSRLAEVLVRDSGHNPTPDTMRRVSMTLEALSIQAPLSGGPTPGRLSQDVDPPGFESLTSLVPSADQSVRVPFPPAATASAKAVLEAAEATLHETRILMQDLAAALEQARTHATEQEKDRRAAQDRLEKAITASEEAQQRLHSVATEMERVTSALKGAERRVEMARSDLKDQTENPESRKR